MDPASFIQTGWIVLSSDRKDRALCRQAWSHKAEGSVSVAWDTWDQILVDARRTRKSTRDSDQSQGDRECDRRVNQTRWRSNSSEMYVDC